jgi:hypothetical protein
MRQTAFEPGARPGRFVRAPETRVFEYLAAPRSGERVELQCGILIESADPTVSDVRHRESVRFPVRQSAICLSDRET